MRNESGQGLIAYCLLLLFAAVIIIGMGMLLIGELDKNNNGILDIRESSCPAEYDENGWLRNCHGNVLEPGYYEEN